MAELLNGRSISSMYQRLKNLGRIIDPFLNAMDEIMDGKEGFQLTEQEKEELQKLNIQMAPFSDEYKSLFEELHAYEILDVSLNDGNVANDDED
jgi:hypothetical protein